VGVVVYNLLQSISTYKFTKHYNFYKLFYKPYKHTLFHKVIKNAKPGSLV